MQTINNFCGVAKKITRNAKCKQVHGQQKTKEIICHGVDYWVDNWNASDRIINNHINFIIQKFTFYINCLLIYHYKTWVGYFTAILSSIKNKLNNLMGV